MCLTLSTLFTLERCSQRVHGTLVVLSGIIKLLFLFLDSAINLLANLSKLKLSSKNLVLFLFKSSLSFLKGRLELFFLNFQAATLFVQLMDRATTIFQLVKEILDFISKVLVFPLDNIKLFHNLIMSSLEPVKLTVVVTALLLASINLSINVVRLSLPFTNDFVKVLAPLLSDNSSSMSSLIVHGKLLQVSLHACPGFLSIANLSIQGFHILLSLLDCGLELITGTLQLINTSQTFLQVSLHA